MAEEYFEGSSFRAVEIERGIFHLLDKGKGDIAARILVMALDKRLQPENVEKAVTFSDSLRGYAFSIHERDNFKCRYCGLDGSESFDNWLSLSWDHLLPKLHPNRDNHEYIVTACMFCNTADNQYFVIGDVHK